MSTRDLTILGCSSQQPTRKRNHGAYLLRWHSEGLLFDPGEGTQRQFIHANIAPTCVNRIFVSHFHGDHCLGLGSMLMRLNLDKVSHPIHCYYPASGKKYFDRLRYGTVYHETIEVIEHPIYEDGLVEETENFSIEAYSLDHGVDNLGYRIKEHDQRKFYKDKLQALGLRGSTMKELLDQGHITIGQERHSLDMLSYLRPGDIFSYVSDTRDCTAARKVAKDASMLLCESTYLQEHCDLAYKHHHLTAKQAAQIAKDANVQELILTHFSARYLDQEQFCEEAKEIFSNCSAAKDLKTFIFPKRYV